jgi:regulatory protein SWI5
MDTPHNRTIKQEQLNQRFLDSYDTAMEETIKPKANQRARGVFEDMRRDAEMHSGPSPPHNDPMSMASNFDSAPMPTANFMSMSTLDLEFLKSESQFQDEQQSPVIANQSPAVSYNSSPEISQRTLRGDAYKNTPLSKAPIMSYPEPPSRSPHSVPESPLSHSRHRRSESVDSINIDETITETGITIDDIATFIHGPDPQDGKWMCLYPDCGKRFGRKENIKSHVQTHLGDRQFQCPHCQKCFVRQHDLKRHAKIHSGVKPYPCQCGNSFARHDALTRHRQRGMCVGAFEGVVKKTVKRGRPRKARPDDEDRLKKSSRTRSKNSPRSDIDVLDEALFGDFQQSQAASLTEAGQSENPQSPTAELGASPIKTKSVASPGAYSTHSNYSRHNSIPEHLPSPPRSPAHSQHSHYHSPPGLCDSSSSPAPSNYYDMDSISNHGEALQTLSLANISEHEDEMFLEAFAAAGATSMSQLERDPELLLSKFDDNFANTSGEDLFKDEADVFFGSP